ncbi:MAG: class I fructose-bisphosphate aldolase [Pseudomonadota bacterium]
MSIQELEATVAALTAPGKGILAADESLGTIEKRFRKINVPSTEENRRSYREMLFSTPGLGEFIGGVILFDETLRQRGSDGTPIPQLLRAQGIVPGIKVDKGTVPLPNFPDEVVTQGLDGLAERLAEYRSLGARFAKWRAVLRIGAGMPSRRCITENANALARYAAICQAQGLVPIVEPEVLIDGDHSFASAAQVTEDVLHQVFHALHEQRVTLELMLLKPSMVVPGADSGESVSAEAVASATLACLRRAVPAAVPGIFFLSGGQGNEEATAHLNAINVQAGQAGQAPWVLSFSYARALQAPALEAWRGEAANREAAQRVLHQRARLNSLARQGRYSAALEQ